MIQTWLRGVSGQSKTDMTPMSLAIAIQLSHMDGASAVKKVNRRARLMNSLQEPSPTRSSRLCVTGRSVEERKYVTARESRGSSYRSNDGSIKFRKSSTESMYKEAVRGQLNIRWIEPQMPSTSPTQSERLRFNYVHTICSTR